MSTSLIHFFRGCVYVKNDGRLYGVGKIIFQLNIFNVEVFNDFLRSLTLQQWAKLLQHLKTLERQNGD